MKVVVVVSDAEHFEVIRTLSRTCGPVLGPFTRRDTALQAEAKWLCENLTPIPRE